MPCDTSVIKHTQKYYLLEFHRENKNSEALLTIRSLMLKREHKKKPENIKYRLQW